LLLGKKTLAFFYKVAACGADPVSEVSPDGLVYCITTNLY
jgi:hypothetical protein